MNTLAGIERNDYRIDFLLQICNIVSWVYVRDFSSTILLDRKFVVNFPRVTENVKSYEYSEMGL